MDNGPLILIYKKFNLQFCCEENYFPQTLELHILVLRKLQPDNFVLYFFQDHTATSETIVLETLVTTVHAVPTRTVTSVSATRDTRGATADMT